jgi:hypothetical protein
MRAVGRELSLQKGDALQAHSLSLAKLFLGRLTAPSVAAVRAEMQITLEDVLVLPSQAEKNNAKADEDLGEPGQKRHLEDREPR